MHWIFRPDVQCAIVKQSERKSISLIISDKYKWCKRSILRQIAYFHDGKCLFFSRAAVRGQSGCVWTEAEGHCWDVLCLYTRGAWTLLFKLTVTSKNDCCVISLGLLDLHEVLESTGLTILLSFRLCVWFNSFFAVSTQSASKKQQVTMWLFLE